jgi:DNA-binding NarL/FixJ family response regulator
MMRVSVVSEQLLTAELAASALRAVSGLEVTWVVGGVSALEGPSGARALRAQVVLFAALAPPEVGMGRRLAEGHEAGDRRILVVADVGGCVGLPRALQLGARGYVGAWEREEVMASRVLQAGQGHLAVPPGAADGLRLAMRLLVREATAVNRLSETDLEVMRALSRGEATKEIAARLNVTESAVRSRLRRIMGQLDVRNENELSAMAASAGLYEPRAPAAA